MSLKACRLDSCLQVSKIQNVKPLVDHFPRGEGDDLQCTSMTWSKFQQHFLSLCKDIQTSQFNNFVLYIHSLNPKTNNACQFVYKFRASYVNFNSSQGHLPIPCMQL